MDVNIITGPDAVAFPRQLQHLNTDRELSIRTYPGMRFVN